MSSTQKRKKRNVPEFAPPVPQCIEIAHTSKESISEAEFKSITIIDKNNFKELIENYIYAINFPNDSALQEIYELSTPNIYSIILPYNLKKIHENSFKECKFLSQITFLLNDSGDNNLQSIENHAFDKTIVQSIVIPDKVEEIGSFCFPPTLNQLELNKGCPKLKKVSNNAFDHIQIEKFNMPLNIHPFIESKNVFKGCKKLKHIVFDSYTDLDKLIEFDSDSEKAEDEKINLRKSENRKWTLFENYEEYFMNCLYSSTNIAVDAFELKMTQDFVKSLMFSQISLQKLEFIFSNINYMCFYNTPSLVDITVQKSDNSRYVKEDGCLYTKDLKKLIVAERNIKSAKIKPECQVITNYAFNVKSLEKVSFDKISNLEEISFFVFSESQIKEIKIPDSVNYIDYGSFYKCTKLESVNFPKSMSIIDYVTFSMTNLREITIPKNITKLKYACFYKCSQLKTVKFESNSNLSEIDDFSFAFTNLDSIQIPKTVSRIGDYAFLKCSNLKSIQFEDNSNLSEIGSGCFVKTLIENFQLPQKIKCVDLSYTNAVTVSFSKLASSITELSDFNYSMLKQISIPSSITKILNGAFYECANLAEVKINDPSNSKLEEIGNYAFFNCKLLTTFDIPKTVKHFGFDAFKNCFNYRAQIKIETEKKVEILEHCFENSGITGFHSKSNFIKVRDSAFKRCQNLNEVSATTVIGCSLSQFSFAFCNCLEKVKLSPNANQTFFEANCFMNSSLKEINIPNEILEIPQSCFKNCKELAKVTIDEDSKLETFSAHSFSNSGIESIFIPSQTKDIEEFAFSECKNLNTVTFSKVLNECCLHEKAFYMSGIETTNIPKNIVTIEVSCFEKCSNLKKITFSEDSMLTEINEHVFESSSIESITLSASISRIKKEAFKNCEKLEKVDFLCDDVTIEPFAFVGCKKLQEVKYVLSLNVEMMISPFPEEEIFSINFKDEKISKELIEPLFASKEAVFHIINFPYMKNYYLVDDKWSSNDAFCKKVTSLLKDDSERSIVYNYKNGFYIDFKRGLIHCDFSIESISIPKETEIIHASALKYSPLKVIEFEKNSKLNIIENCAFENLQIEKITIPDSVTIIDDYVFHHCHLLKTVEISSKSQLKKIGKFAFCGTSIESILLPSKLNKIDDYAFYECYKLQTVDNQSNQIKFKRGCFSKSSIENIKFPQNSTFCEDSFKKCHKLKKLEFIENPTKVVFKEESFAFSGLEELKMKHDALIHPNSFMFCSSLKKVCFYDKNIHIEENPFYFSNVEMIILELKMTNFEETEKTDIFQHRYFNDVLNSTLKNVSLKLTFSDEKKRIEPFEHEFFLNHNCYVVNNTLIYADMINNSILFEKQANKEEMKKNEIIQVPGNVKKFNFTPMTHIKKIKWSSNNSVEDLGPNGFFSFYSLTQIVIPKLVKNIPDRLFEHCHFLESVIFEKDCQLEKIGDFSFSNTKIAKIILPKSLQVIGKSAFSNNKNLKEAVFEGKIIGDGAFSETGIEKFNLSNHTEVIGSEAFKYCKSLTSFEIDIEKSELTEIGSFAFSESSIAEIKIPPKIKKIQKFTFSGCKFLKNVIISNKSALETIEKYSFSGCLFFDKINIPKTTVNLSFKAFVNTPSLKSIMNESSQYFDLKNDNSVYTKNNNELIFVPRNLSSFQITKSCPKIHSGSFCGKELNEISYSDHSLTSIEKLSFAHCTKLKKITIPNSVQFIGTEAFIDCQSLEKVEFESKSQIKEIPKFCFAFTSLNSVKLPPSIEIIHHSSFFMCQNLKKINLSNTNTKYIGEYAFANTSLEEVKCPCSVKFIGNHAFGDIKTLKMLDLSELTGITEDERSYRAKKHRRFFNRLLKSQIVNKKIDLTEESTDEKVVVGNNEPLLTVPPTSSDEQKTISSSLSSHYKLTIQKPTIVKPSSKFQLINPFNPSKSYGTIKFSSSHVLTQNALPSIVPNDLPEIKTTTATATTIANNGRDEFVKKLQETIRNLQESNNEQSEIIKEMQETIRKLQESNKEKEERIKKQEQIIKEQEETIKELRGVSTKKQDQIVNDEEEMKKEQQIDQEENPDTKTQKRGRLIGPNSDCIIDKYAFCNSLAKVVKCNLSEYKWFTFLNKLTRIEEYVVNGHIQLVLSKSSIDTYKFDDRNDFISNSFKINKLKWENQEKIPKLENQNITDFYVSKSVAKLNSYNFSECFELTKIVFEDGINIKVIPSHCFHSTSLSKIKIPSTVTTIEKSSFFECSNLEEVIFVDENKLENIGPNAFARCTKLKSIKLS